MPTPPPTRRLAAALPAVLACLLALPSQAACTFSTKATTIAFGNYDVSSTTPLTTSAAFTARCTGTLYMLIQVGASAHGGGYNPRLMKHSTLSDTLQYNLYQDAGYSTIWGDTSYGSGYIFQLFTINTTYSGTIYGRLTAGQDVTPGTYTDTVSISVTP